jgi:Pentapeptide repeats (8 copies)/Family of unknown function (DUF5758)
MDKLDMSGKSLRGTDLRGTDLRGANLTGADLMATNLRGADLRDAKLRGAYCADADFSYADLEGADLTDGIFVRADFTGAIMERGDLPTGELTVYKKLKNGGVCTLRIPAEAKRIRALGSTRCRAEYALVLEGEGRSFYGDLHYKAGEIVSPDGYNHDDRVVCAPGIHFFLTRSEAEAY